MSCDSFHYAVFLQMITLIALMDYLTHLLSDFALPLYTLGLPYLYVHYYSPLACSSLFFLFIALSKGLKGYS